MLKRLGLAFAGLFAFVQLASAAGTIPFSLTTQFDKSTGRLLSGGKLYFIQAGTVNTPQNAFQDSGLTIPWPNPITLDTTARVPQLFFADGSIKLLLTNSLGVTQFTADGLLVIGASSGGGGGSPVDPTTVLAPCDIKVVYGTGVVTGFVRMNGRTIGNAVSGATERANADTLAAFSCLYANDNNLVVSGGRGASAAADYAAGKTIATPDYRGRALAGLDDMGNSAASRLTATYFGTSATVLGAAGGTQSHTLSIAEMPSHDHGANTGGMSANALHSHTYSASNSINVQAAGSGTGVNSGVTTGNTSTVDLSHSHPIPAQGGGGAHATVTPTMLATIYLKL